MKACLLLLFLLISGYGIVSAQTTDPKPVSKGASHAVSFAAQVPVGVFARSHIAGAGLGYAWSAHRFGRNVLPAKRIGLTANGGADYYLGKRITTAGHDFRYGSYFYFHAMAGMMVNPWQNSHFSLTAGPGLGLYEGNTDLGLIVSLAGNHFISSRMAIGPGIVYRKHAGADALWTGSVRVYYTF